MSKPSKALPSPLDQILGYTRQQQTADADPDAEFSSCFFNPTGYLKSHPWIFEGISQETLLYMEMYKNGDPFVIAQRQAERMSGGDGQGATACRPPHTPPSTIACIDQTCTSTESSSCFDGFSRCSSGVRPDGRMSCNTDGRLSYATSDSRLSYGTSSARTSSTECDAASWPPLSETSSPTSPVMKSLRHVKVNKKTKSQLKVAANRVPAGSGSEQNGLHSGCADFRLPTSTPTTPAMEHSGRSRLRRFFCLAI